MNFNLKSSKYKHIIHTHILSSDTGDPVKHKDMNVLIWLNWISATLQYLASGAI